MNTPINLYIATRMSDYNDFCLYESAVSNEMVSVKSHEYSSITRLVNVLLSNGIGAELLSGFYHSFLIPQIGKEFDLLKITSGSVVNIELKSDDVNEDKIKQQLEKNSYYLSHLNKKKYLFSYNSKSDILFVLNDGVLEKSNINSLIDVLALINDETIYTDSLESMFKASDFLVSPLNTPKQFLKNEYFLTQQQAEFKYEIINKIKSKGTYRFISLTGDPGTGKTLLTYDIAKSCAEDLNCCIIHCGILSEGHNYINNHLDNITIISAKEINQIELTDFDCIFLDEVQRLYKSQFETVINHIIDFKKFGLFSFDPQQVLAKTEEKNNIPFMISLLKNKANYNLSQKIRTNKEMAIFIKKLFDLRRTDLKPQYGKVEILYANDKTEVHNIVNIYIKQGYEHINYTPSRFYSCSMDQYRRFGENTHRVIGQEFDNIIMVMDSTFYYENGILKATPHPNPDYIYTKLLFQGITRVREKLCLVIVGDKELFRKIMSIFEE